MRKKLSYLACGILVFMSIGCSKQVEKEQTELTVFAAASMTETLTEIGEKYEKNHENVKVTFNFDSSGTLKTQIEEGAVCDLFISAAQKQMDELQVVEEDTRVNLLENKVTLVVPEENGKKITSFDDMISGLKEGSILLGMGNEDVPVGQYTQKVLSYYGLSEEELSSAGNITYGSNVKEVTTQVAEGVVDCGVIYATDAYSANLTVVDEATKEMCGQVIYPAAVLSTSEEKEEAEEFLDYLQTEEAMQIFASVGFSKAE